MQTDLTQRAQRGEAATAVAQVSLPAVSQGFQPASLRTLGRTGFRTASRLEIGDTAGWKPALRRNASARILARCEQFAQLQRKEQPGQLHLQSTLW